MELPPYIEFLVKAGLPVSILYEDDYLTYDLNTGMKSDAKLSVREGNIHIKTRYGTATITPRNDVSDTVKEIVHTVGERCMCGRTYALAAWFDLFETFRFDRY